MVREHAQVALAARHLHVLDRALEHGALGREHAQLELARHVLSTFMGRDQGCGCPGPQMSAPWRPTPSSRRSYPGSRGAGPRRAGAAPGPSPAYAMAAIFSALAIASSMAPHM